MSLIEQLKSQALFQIDGDDNVIGAWLDPHVDEEHLELRLLIVDDDMPTIWDVFEIRFKARPDDNLHFPFSLLVLSQEEFEALQKGDIDMPDRWSKIDQLVRIKPSDPCLKGEPCP